LLRAAEPGFLIFGGLGVIVHADIGNGLDTAACVAARWSFAARSARDCRA
jgi:hypothetical protein